MNPEQKRKPFANLLASGLLLTTFFTPVGLAQAATSTGTAGKLPTDYAASDDYAKSAIARLAAEQVIVGDKDGKFHPKDTVSRAEMITMIVKTLHLVTTHLPSTPTFKDVPKHHWAFPYVEAAYQAGIVAGVGPGVFGVDQKCSREQMAAFYTRSLGLTQAEIANLSTREVNGHVVLDAFRDKGQFSTYGKDPAAFAVAENLMHGTSSTTFAPRDAAPREQVAVVTDNLLQNQTQLEQVVSAYHVASNAQVTSDTNGIYLKFEQPVKNVDAVLYTPGVVRAEDSNAAADSVPLPGWEHPYLSADRTEWSSARPVEPGKTYDLVYYVTLDNGDEASIEKQITIGDNGLHVTAQLVDASTVQVTFNRPINPNAATDAQAYVVQDENSSFTIDSATPQPDANGNVQKILLKLRHPLTSDSKITLNVRGRMFAPLDRPADNPFIQPWVDPGSNPADLFEGFESTFVLVDTNTTPPTITTDFAQYDSHVDESYKLPLTQNHTVAEMGAYQDDGDVFGLSGHLILETGDASNGPITAFDAETLQQAWEYDHGDFYNGLVVGTPNAVLETEDNGTSVQSLSAADGKPMWKHPVDGKVVAMQGDETHAFVLTGDKLYALNAADGAELWTADVASGAVVNVNDTRVVVGTKDGKVLAFALDGKALFTVPETIAATAPDAVSTATNGTDSESATASSTDSSTTTGADSASATVDATADATPPALATTAVTSLQSLNGMTIVYQGKAVSVIDQTDKVVWTDTLNNDIVGGQAALSSNANRLYVVTTSQTLMGLDLMTGEVMTATHLTFPAADTPAVDDSTLYIPTATGHLVSVDATTLASHSVITYYTHPNTNGYTDGLQWRHTPILYKGNLIGLTLIPDYTGGNLVELALDK